MAVKVLNKLQKAIARRPRRLDKKGLQQAKKETTMTKDEWQRLQKGMAEKFPRPQYMLAQPAHPEGKGHTAYRDETFEIMTRMKADTKIWYRPNAKAPGTAKTPNKSHVRYLKYQDSKTVGQALERGSWPADWCWDYERGFLQIDVETLREDPIDITQHIGELTATDEAVYRWYRKELCKKLGLKLEDLILDKGSQETTLIRAHRLVAQREAKKVLQRCRKTKGMVQDSDLLKILDSWGFAKNGTRINVMREGQKFVWSDTLGLLIDRMGDVHCTQRASGYPEVVQVINKWLADRLPKEARSGKFVWTSLNVNKNYAANIHRDANNFGPSMISAFGDFTGGALNYFPTDDGAGDPAKLLKGGYKKESFDLKNGLALFNGNNGHCVDDFEGSRYSIVYFTSGCHAKMPESVRAELVQMGFRVPSIQQDPFTLLQPPLKKHKAASAASKKLPPFRYWSKKSLA